MIYYKPLISKPIKDIKKDDINLNAVTISAASAYFEMNGRPKHNCIIVYLYLNCDSGNEFYYTSDDDENTAVYRY